ncbi:MAG TPA: MOSC N-terminal beta barrel domain-containing protein [Thermoleophilaceae bacterium]|nr:MOSC N-terminal beta barrel domain-containing protein [Thermoleophilaceae bacterium]
MAENEVGRVAELWRYPVKSMAGEPLHEADVSWFGLAGDRRWAFIRPGIVESGFPWLTIRERSDLCRYRPRFRDPSQPDTSATVVTTPGGEELDVTDAALAAELGDGLQLIRQYRGAFDALPLSLMGTGSVRAIGEVAGRELPVQRFRPNLVVEPADGAPFAEDGWIGSTLRIGGMRMRVDDRDPRCVVVNVDPETTERDPAVLRAIAQTRDSCLGVYGSTVEPGRVAVGDAVVLE